MDVAIVALEGFFSIVNHDSHVRYMENLEKLWNSRRIVETFRTTFLQVEYEAQDMSDQSVVPVSVELKEALRLAFDSISDNSTYSINYLSAAPQQRHR